MITFIMISKMCIEVKQSDYLLSQLARSYYVGITPLVTDQLPFEYSISIWRVMTGAP